jgi:DNA-binding CsgD family transcriptional regulator
LDEKEAMIKAHEDGSTADELANQYGITPRSVAAYVANAHR